jgi:hypothetical protein
MALKLEADPKCDRAEEGAPVVEGEMGVDVNAGFRLGGSQA